MYCVDHHGAFFYRRRNALDGSRADVADREYLGHGRGIRRGECAAFGVGDRQDEACRLKRQTTVQALRVGAAPIIRKTFLTEATWASPVARLLQVTRRRVLGFL